MVRLLYCRGGYFLCSNDPHLEDFSVELFQDSYVKEVIEALKISGDFIKRFHLKFGLKKRPPQPLITFAPDYFANPYHWLITIPSSQKCANEPVSSVSHETAHCLHWAANSQIWEQRNIPGRKGIEARSITEVVAELSAQIYLESLSTRDFYLKNFSWFKENEISRLVNENYPILKEYFETLISAKRTDDLDLSLRRLIFQEGKNIVF